MSAFACAAKLGQVMLIRGGEKQVKFKYVLLAGIGAAFAISAPAAAQSHCEHNFRRY